MSVSSEFGRRAADDKLCAEVERAVREDDADALRRLGLDGWGDYVQRLSELMNESVRDELDYSPDFGALMSQVASPARYAHHLVTESGMAVQKAKDTPLGIHIKPLEPEFDDDALKGTVGTAANAESPEQAVETLADGLAYAVKKAGNEFIEKNAEQRSRAGFEVGVKRSGSTKCCPWCAARIGSWALKNAPDDIFGCHANCSCVVEYTSSTGARSQRRGTGRFVEVEYQPPHVMTYEEAKEKGGFDEPKRLTKSSAGDIIESESKWLPRKEHMSLEQFHELRDYGAQYGIAFSGLKSSDSDPALIREAIDSARTVLSRYPELKESKFGQIIFRISQAMDDADYAFVNPDKPNVIHLNANAYRDKEALKADYNKLVESRFFPKGTSYNSITVHELGHLYQHIHEIPNEEIILMAKRAAQVDTDDELFSYLMKNLSEYSSVYDDGTEIISEVFSDYFTSDAPKEFSQRFMKEIEERR